MRRVLVGVDGSDSSAAAGRWAARLARRTGAELIAATAWTPKQAEEPPQDLEDRRDAARAHLDGDWTTTIRDVGVEPRTRFLDGGPDRLLEAAEEVDADLLVVGTSHIDESSPLHLGSVAHRLAHHTRRPLAIVPFAEDRTEGETEISTIALCVDGSGKTTDAIDWCADAAAALDAKVVAVAAVQPFFEWVPKGDPLSWRREFEEQAMTWVEPLQEAGVAVLTRTTPSDEPAETLLDAAKRAQLIVVGTQGLNKLGLRLGGTAMRLLNRTAVPLVMVPPGSAGGRAGRPGGPGEGARS